MRGEERSDGVGIFVAEKWVDNVVSVKRHRKSTNFEDSPGQWFTKCSYGLCTSLRESGGGKRELLE